MSEDTAVVEPVADVASESVTATPAAIPPNPPVSSPEGSAAEGELVVHEVHQVVVDAQPPAGSAPLHLADDVLIARVTVERERLARR